MADVLDAAIAEAGAYNMRQESEARALDQRLAALPGIPDGYLNARRNSGQLRNPLAGPHANETVRQALMTSWDPEAQQLLTWLAAKANVALPSPDYAKQEQAEQAAALDAAMATEVEELKASRRAALAEYAERQAQGLRMPPELL